MRHYGGRRRSRRTIPKDVVVHVPSSMSNSPGANTGIIIIAVTPSIFAGASATTDLSGFEDRDRTVTVGKSVKSIKFDVTVRNPLASGDIQCIVFKIERALTVPVLGVGSIPSSGQMNSEGAQQAWRLRNPGRVLYYGHIPFTPETTRNKVFRVPVAKYRMAKVRPGDTIGLCIFNKSSSSANVDVEMLYKSQA